jgi:hypothetical protein
VHDERPGSDRPSLNLAEITKAAAVYRWCAVLRLPSGAPAVVELAARSPVGRDGCSSKAPTTLNMNVSRAGGVVASLVVGPLKDGAVDIVPVVEHPG